MGEASPSTPVVDQSYAAASLLDSRDAVAVSDPPKAHVASVPSDETPEADQIRGSYGSTT